MSGLTLTQQIWLAAEGGAPRGGSALLGSSIVSSISGAVASLRMGFGHGASLPGARYSLPGSGGDEHGGGSGSEVARHGQERIGGAVGISRGRGEAVSGNGSDSTLGDGERRAGLEQRGSSRLLDLGTVHTLVDVWATGTSASGSNSGAAPSKADAPAARAVLPAARRPRREAPGITSYLPSWLGGDARKAPPLVTDTAAVSATAAAANQEVAAALAGASKGSVQAAGHELLAGRAAAASSSGDGQSAVACGRAHDLGDEEFFSQWGAYGSQG